MKGVCQGMERTQSIKISTKHGEKIVCIGDNVTLEVKGEDNLIQGKVELIYSDGVRLINDTNLYYVDEIEYVAID